MTERAFWLAWSQISGIGAILIQRLHHHFNSLAAAWEAPAARLAEVEGFGRTTVETAIAQRRDIDPERLLEQHLQRNPLFWTPADAEYPKLLLEIPNPPPALYYKGLVQPLENQGLKPAVAIVGTREPTDYGKRWTRRISALLAQNGFTIVSGMAQGIDTEAHWGCLEAGGRTIAALGTGVNLIYPPRNQDLYNKIIANGLVVSEYPADTQPSRAHFPQRNRIIAGLSRAVLVMEAPNHSGALITAYLANEFCRDIYILPGRLDDEKSRGCLGLLSRGAHVIIHEKYLLECLGSIPQLDTPQQLSLFDLPVPQPEPHLEPKLKQVWQVISTEPTSLDFIVQTTGLETGFVLSSLSQLELMDLVKGLPGMRYQRI